MDKLDMSDTCGQNYESNWYSAHVTRTLSQEKWQKWYSEYCANCKYMCEVCMFGEEN
jgi:hypothetical protein